MQWNEIQNNLNIKQENIKLKQNKPHYCKKKEQNVKILYVCISSFRILIKGKQTKNRNKNHYNIIKHKQTKQKIHKILFFVSFWQFFERVRRRIFEAVRARRTALTKKLFLISLVLVVLAEETSTTWSSNVKEENED